MKGFQHKTPKNRIACIEAITTIIRTFGVPTVNVKELLKTLAKLFDDSDAKVRQETTKLTVELYRWIKDVVKSYIKDCRQVWSALHFVFLILYAICTNRLRTWRNNSKRYRMMRHQNAHYAPISTYQYRNWAILT